MLRGVDTDPDRGKKLPVMESASALTSAKIDLLPHQVVLTHRIATASPRRYLIADEVGLGKTIETALILRELASRGELSRALMVVPAGLVHNWHRELNEVFNLDFEVFRGRHHRPQDQCVCQA
jgi:SNF2 family DNA or RNA helicase